LRVANANMEHAIRVVSVERGHDPRDFALVAFGGCGGLHACEIARELGMDAVIVPQYAGALSALGMLLADAARDYAAGALGHVDLEARFRTLEQRARRESPGANMERTAAVRYRGQSYELNVPWRGSRTAGVFHREHQRVYGYSLPARDVEVVTIRVRARAAAVKPKLRRIITRKGPAKSRPVWTGGAWADVPVWNREQLSAPHSGPALVLDYGSTTLVPAGWNVHLDARGNLVVQMIEREK
jgi:N-methylhydantoinase A